MWRCRNERHGGGRQREADCGYGDDGFHVRDDVWFQDIMSCAAFANIAMAKSKWNNRWRGWKVEARCQDPRSRWRAKADGASDTLG